MSEETGFKYEEFATKLGFSVLCTVALHPMDFAEFLIQIGHTPIPGYPQKTFIGLQNTLKYIGHIRSKDGCLGCYRGVVASVRTKVIGSSALTAFTHNVRTFHQEPGSEEDLSLSTFLSTLWKEIVKISVTIIVTQPFVVISWRVMGQFVGREEIYSSFFWSIGEIYSRSGVTGFFTGLVPRWLGEAIAQSLTLSISHLINCFLITDPLHRALAKIVVGYTCYVFTYPLTVAAVCFGVNDCGLACGKPPNMPIFEGWMEALAFIMSPKKQLNLEQSQ